jgi:translation initiation factor 2 beta subunit (eIF-2beta)/eIF-5
MQTQKQTEAKRIDFFKCMECGKTGCTYSQRVECNAGSEAKTQ